MKIAIDLDDVVLDFCGGLVRVLNTEYDAGLSRDDIKEWDLGVIINPIVGENWWGWMRRRNWLWSTFDAIPGAIGGLEHLRREGHYLELLTSKPRWAEYNVWKWLGKWRPPVHRVTIVGPDDAKIDFSDAEVLVDDKPGNIEAWQDGGRKGVLFEHPHNQGYFGNPWARARDWSHLLYILEPKTGGLLHA